MFHTCENDIHLAASQRVLLRELQGAVKVGIPGRGEECGAGPCGVAHALGKVKSSGGQMHGVLPSNVSAPTI